MKALIRFITILSVLFLVAGSVYAGKRDPAAVLFQVKGDVEYSKKGTKWRKVRRNKFLFSGYQVRSLGDGTGKVTLKSTGQNFVLEPNTVFVVAENDLEIQQGNLVGVEKSNQLVSGLIKKFSKSQSYTTVRRNAQKKELDSVRSLVVSADYPYLIWDNIDDQASYKVMVGSELYSIPATAEDTVKVKLKPFAGTLDYKIEAIKDEKMIAELKPFRSRGETKSHSVSWLTEDEHQKLKEGIMALTAEYGEGSFMLGTYFEKQDMWVAAMEQYQQYLADNRDDIEMTPYLFRVYKKLKLDSRYKKELNEWNQAMAE